MLFSHNCTERISYFERLSTTNSKSTFTAKWSLFSDPLTYMQATRRFDGVRNSFSLLGTTELSIHTGRNQSDMQVCLICHLSLHYTAYMNQIITFKYSTNAFHLLMSNVLCPTHSKALTFNQWEVYSKGKGNIQLTLTTCRPCPS